MLIILGGLPGTGKSTIAKRIAARLGAVYLRVDTIEQTLKNLPELGLLHMGAEGYLLSYVIAKDNLSLGLWVVADSVNPVELSRADWRKVAEDSGAPFIEIEVICTDKEVHRKRVETRKADIVGLELPTWQDVVDREYESWVGKALSIDTARYTVDDAEEIVVDYIMKNQFQTNV